MPAELANYQWLISDEARPWLERCRDEVGRTSLVALTARLRRELSAERTHLLLEQVELRDRARAKFLRAETMFFTSVALEQATDEIVASYKAERFPNQGLLVDLCCGIGGDAMPLARRGERSLGIDRNPIHALMATENVRQTLARFGRSGDAFAVAVAGAEALREEVAAWHADPDRRSAGKRTTSVDAHDPPAEVLDAWRARQPSAAIKLAPAARLPDAWNQHAEREWISRGGECRQLVAWFGRLARHPGSNVATLVAANRPPQHVIGQPGEPIPYVERVGRFVFEPDAAVLAAQLVGALARQHALSGFAAGIPYLTSDDGVIDPALAAFAVQDVLPFRVKTLEAYCRQQRIGRVEVKKRGVDCEPAQLQRQLAGAGDEMATVLITRQGDKAIAIVARRVQSPHAIGAAD